jgi:tellurite resistance protein TehA-like permease
MSVIEWVAMGLFAVATVIFFVWVALLILKH